ncbi:helix-turn-helix domain-containing protein [uncultured Desulfobulbus sp.]|uniref:helix-turn-helix domain-containing protein n=1 Tax=uncultured Desulfobulbus sp. TaxID=239745 RepID=UPI0029C885E9|nr:helix-turn-helix domain-containing protein [uncultured Desulfobulbus sp.]
MTAKTNNVDSASIQSSTAHRQRQRILEHLKYSTLTTLHAREQLDIMHPSMRVLELKRRGHNIRTEWTTEHSAGGSRHRIARYILEAAADE